MQDKLRLPNGLMLTCYEKEEVGETTGTKRKFSIMQIFEDEKEIAYMSKLLEINGKTIESNWG